MSHPSKWPRGTIQEWNFILRSVAARYTCQSAPDDLRPYNARVVISTTLPQTSPVSTPPSNHIFSRHVALKNAILPSPVSTSRSIRLAMRNAKQTMSQETFLEYVIESGVSVVCPPALNLALWVKSIGTSKITWQRISWKPIIKGSVPVQACWGMISSTGFQGTLTFVISLPSALHKKSVPFSSSIAKLLQQSLGFVCQIHELYANSA